MDIDKVPEIEIVDREDGAKGHFCVRKIVDGTAWHWNRGEWAAFGQVLDQPTATAIARLESQAAQLQARVGELTKALRLIADGEAFQQDAESNCISDDMSVARAALAAAEGEGV